MDVKNLFAVDLGASGGKCFLGSFEKDEFQITEIHRFAYEGVDFFIPDRTGKLTQRTYWDDTLIYGNILKGIQKVGRETGAGIDSIGIDTWGTDGMMVSEDGESLGKIHCYRDHRLDNMIEEVKERIDPSWLYSITGIHFQPFNLSNQLLWFVTRRKDLLRPKCRLLPVPTVFYYYLGGVTQVDSSWASVTQLMDARSKNWSKEVLDALEIPERILPEIVSPGRVTGQMHRELADFLDLPLPPKLIAVASHDTASAFAAAPVEDRDKALIISSGTWSLIGKLVDEPITSDEAMKANISNEGGIGNTRFLMNCMGSWIAQELLRGWETADGKPMSWREADALTLAAPAFSGFIDPDHRGFYNPPDMEAAVRGFLAETGQDDVTDRGALLRLVFESLALKYRLVDEKLNAVCHGSTEVVHIVGGGSNNALLNRFTADALGLPVLAGPSEATAAGNLMAQALGMGVIRNLGEAQSLIRSAFSIRSYSPGDTAAWDHVYPRFCKLCD